MSEFDAKHDQDDPTREEAGERSLGRDALGLVLFAFATLLGVSVFMSVSRPAVEPHGTTALFTALVGMLGAWPLILLALALALLGGRTWVAGVVQGLPRHVGGALALTLAVAVLAGAASEGGGGAVGDLLGGTLTRAASAFVGVPLGLALVAVVVWVVWLRVPLAGLAALRPSRPAPAAAADADSGGLTDDEAAALLPPTEPAREVASSQIPEASPAPAAARLSGRSIPISPDLKPLYPPDVRLQGQIPEGARPLETRDQPQAKKPARSTPAADPHESPSPERRGRGDRPHPSHPGPVQRASEPDAEASQRSAEPDLASPVTRWEPRPDALSDEPPVVQPLEARPPSAEAARPLETPAAPLAPSWEAEPLAEPLAELPAAELPAAEAPEEVRPSPEVAEAVEPAGAPPRPAWEQPGLFDEEPVDAYGTPKSLVAALRESNQEAAGRLAAAPAEEEELDEEEAEEVYAEGDELDADAEDEEAGEEEEDEEYAEDEEEELDEEEAEEAYAEDEELDEEVEPEELEEASAAVEEPEPEPEVVLEPKPTQRKAAATRTRSKASPAQEPAPPSLDPADDLVYRAGALFIERGRVAVSMLQREYSMDFKQATAVLDQLQEAGLIGPYLGGQRRDILLSLEEWRERRVGAS